MLYYSFVGPVLQILVGGYRYTSLALGLVGAV